MVKGGGTGWVELIRKRMREGEEKGERDDPEGRSQAGMAERGMLK